MSTQQITYKLSSYVIELTIYLNYITCFLYIYIYIYIFVMYGVVVFYVKESET